ncbi:DUF6702 family protein [Aureibaculum conchae]|uniref:DUF6702 family protein n=1 Tax=Aureibaculum sp. 2308TA14-22 TaxID=3108392 RepID=UPI003396B2D1
MFRSKFLLLLLILPIFAFTPHKFYISLIKVEFKPEQEAVQITMRIFIDDLQKVINETNDINIELAVKNEVKNSDELIIKYIEDNFYITINSKNTSYNYLGKEYDNDIVYLYLEITNIKKMNSIEVNDTMLMDYFPTQKNIIKLKANNSKKTLFLTKNKNKESYTF